MKRTPQRQKVRVRFAPSPTGFLHIGGLRTALYNYLFARKHGGALILRIEDTDRMRTVAGGIADIVRTLSWIGLTPDEGVGAQRNFQFPISNFQNVEVDIGETGKYGPYVQSQRLPIYQKHTEMLVKKGKAYYCTCTPERLEELRQGQISRKEMPRYDGHCRKLGVRGQGLGASFVVRLRVPERGSTKFTDIIRGKVEFENKLIDDQVLLKSDGFPTYHLANVVDDHLMKITHVIRGEEWLPSTPKHVLLYKAFKWKPPRFAHLPLLLNSDHSKLSKRQGDVAVEDYIKKGYLRDALLNFVALLGWNPRADKELYTLDELIAEFDLEKVNKSGAVVNFEKLDWTNGHYIRQMPIGKLEAMAMPYLNTTNVEFARRVIALERERVKKLSELTEATEYFFVDQPHFHGSMLIWKNTPPEKVLIALEKLYNYLRSYREKWDAKTLEVAIKSWIARTDLKVGEVLWPMRVALSGRLASPPPFEIAAILGTERTLSRIHYAISLAKKL
ncbi:glutamate--tRNA ligase [Candidatus Uhrbacteria bacterium]|nr:glutamate--tRNA ligase [Candidatus Uhrbacteria bacterium]